MEPDAVGDSCARSVKEEGGWPMKLGQNFAARSGYAWELVGLELFVAIQTEIAPSL